MCYECRFFISCVANPELDGVHVVFGQLIEGFDVLDGIEAQGMDGDGATLRRIVIAECGELK
jgi:cyclophilin family peptidyl-prolyl cis-trans isomerase